MLPPVKMYELVIHSFIATMLPPVKLYELVFHSFIATMLPPVKLYELVFHSFIATMLPPVKMYELVIPFIYCDHASYCKIVRAGNFIHLAQPCSHLHDRHVQVQSRHQT